MEQFTRLEYQTKEQWLEMRNNYITGSDASAILGLNPYKTSVELWEEKTAGKKKEFITNALVEYGSQAEDPLRVLFQLTYPEYEVSHTNELLINKKYPFLAGSLDGEIIEKETGRRGVWENKTAYISNAITKANWENGKIPDKYYIQTLHYLLVTGYDFVILQVEMRYDIDEEKWFKRKIYKFTRAEVKEDLEYLLKKETEFWGYIQDKKRPPLEIKNI